MIQRLVFFSHWDALGGLKGGLGRRLGGPGGAVGDHFGGLWVILAAFGAQTAPTTPSSLHFGGLGAERDAKRHPKMSKYR